MRIMPIFAENMAFYIFWAGIVWMGMKKWDVYKRQGEADGHHQHQVDEQEQAAAVLRGQVGEPPQVADARCV